MASADGVARPRSAGRHRSSASPDTVIPQKTGGTPTPGGGLVPPDRRSARGRLPPGHGNVQEQGKTRVLFVGANCTERPEGGGVTFRIEYRKGFPAYPPPGAVGPETAGVPGAGRSGRRARTASVQPPGSAGPVPCGPIFPGIDAPGPGMIPAVRRPSFPAGADRGTGGRLPAPGRRRVRTAPARPGRPADARRCPPMPAGAR